MKGPQSREEKSIPLSGAGQLRGRAAAQKHFAVFASTQQSCNNDDNNIYNNINSDVNSISSSSSSYYYYYYYYYYFTTTDENSNYFYDVEAHNFAFMLQQPQ
jgi:hypothetical protein